MSMTETKTIEIKFYCGCGGKGELFYNREVPCDGELEDYYMITCQWCGMNTGWVQSLEKVHDIWDTAMGSWKNNG